MIVHQIEALVAAGVTDIVLAVNYRPEIMEKFLAEVSPATRPLTATLPLLACDSSHRSLPPQDQLPQ
jgi:NDP-sugar pyrophosphorylase family protein